MTSPTRHFKKCRFCPLESVAHRPFPAIGNVLLGCLAGSASSHYFRLTPEHPSLLVFERMAAQSFRPLDDGRLDEIAVNVAPDQRGVFRSATALHHDPPCKRKEPRHEAQRFVVASRVSAYFFIPRPASQSSRALRRTLPRVLRSDSAISSNASRISLDNRTLVETVPSLLSLRVASVFRGFAMTQRIKCVHRMQGYQRLLMSHCGLCGRCIQ